MTGRRQLMPLLGACARVLRSGGAATLATPPFEALPTGQRATAADCLYLGRGFLTMTGVDVAQRCNEAQKRVFSAEATEETVIITDAAIQRLQELAKEDNSKTVLRVSVSAGGCSGFQYNFDLVEQPQPDDRYTHAMQVATVSCRSASRGLTRHVTCRVFSQDGAVVVADEVSFTFLKGSKIDFEEDLIRSSFQVIDNPSAESSCGCGSSFAPTM
eukprot:CAMPEP_0117687094 /NCGR_PEP_ID=MMETSP0804-20121206/22917_1 /TAXON_ID=1074897 /ORGANISM="Tetraselmis astigmatica, Strain CCMP880" /LENGTH=214 /DNA_ID=CAMNT_0005499065 /DNA_START=42 /DNA_END=686 /DNA_ORIENTATION=+